MHDPDKTEKATPKRRHEARKDTFLFRYDDRPVLEAIGAYRSEASAS